MKRILLLIITIFCMCGCTKLNNENIDNVIADAIDARLDLTNQYRTGFKYYLPTNMSIINSARLNEVLSNGNDKYYLYVDLVSYYEKQDLEYEEKQDVYYSKTLNIDNKKGYLEINVKNDKYLIEIMYNYAKIEVMVDKDSINETVANCLVILSSIKYNDNIIKNMMGEDILNYSEEKFSIFDENRTNDSNFLEYVQEYDNYNEENKVYDYDLIN